MTAYLAFVACSCMWFLTDASVADMHLVTVADSFDLRQIPMISSASYQGYSVRVLGLGKAPTKDENEDSIWGRRLGWKLISFHSFIVDLPDDDVVLFLDAFDVLVIDPPTVLLAKFREMQRTTGRQLFIAAEDHPGYGFRAGEFPKIEGSKWQWINSGAMIGLASAWRKLFSNRSLPSTLPSKYTSDQDWMIDAYLNSSEVGGLAGLDSTCNLFQVTCRVSAITSHDGCKSPEGEVILEEGHIVNTVMGTRPSVLHLVGAGHWAFPRANLRGLFARPRFESCHYYEVARALMPRVFEDLEKTRVWSGKPFAAICTNDPLVWHVFYTNFIVFVIVYVPWIILGTIFLGACFMFRRKMNKIDRLMD